FATATALLLRTVGIPTRVAAGFGHAEWDEEEQEYVVRNSSAHAWAEAWLADWGWYPLDATMWVGVAGSGRDGGHAARRATEARSQGSRLLITVLALFATVQLIRLYRRPRRKKSRRSVDDGTTPLAPLGDPILERPDVVAETPAEEIVLSYHAMQEELRPARLHRRAHQTPREHLRKIGGDLDDLREDIEAIGKVFDDSVYGGGSADASDAEQFRARCRRVVRRLE
ncbi:MAG: transglutaminase domain-containing protein, partial [Phycisphaerales bacterium]|nr:transglutaminase domain-containing protein [Phycisphaerales bacterium]